MRTVLKNLFDILSRIEFATTLITIKNILCFRDDFFFGSNNNSCLWLPVIFEFWLGKISLVNNADELQDAKYIPYLFF